MKKFLLITLLHFSVSSFAQWQEMTPDTEFLHDRIYFHDPSHGIVIGLNGFYQQTYDGGNTWDTANIVNADFSLDPNAANTKDLRCIDFPSDSIGYMGSEDGQIFKTHDGGLHWIYSPSTGTLDHMFDIKFFNNDTGVAESGQYALWRTTDGGNSWNWQLIPQSIPFRFAKINDSTMLFCGSGIFRSTDYGSTWQRMNCDTTILLIDISMSDSLNGVAAGFNGALVRTSDGGLNWSIPTIVTSAHINAVEMLNSTFGFIGCGDYFTFGSPPSAMGFVMYTLDGGLTWSQPDTIAPQTIKDLEFPGDSLGFACGWRGHVLRTLHPTVTTNYTAVNEFHISTAKIFPNPSIDFIYVSLPGIASNVDVTIQVLDIGGRIVLSSQNFNVAPYIIDISSLPSGAYFLHCTVNGIESVSKFVVQH